MHAILDWIFHLDIHVSALALQSGALVYAVLFGFIFLKTGVVILPFLPGDSLLFVVGTLAAKGALSLPLAVVSLVIAAIAGDAANCGVGNLFRKRAVGAKGLPFLKKDHLERTQSFFDRHGKKAIILARFVPMVRTLAPFVAALGHMPYRTFFMFNVIGGGVWVALLLGAGYTLGNIKWFADHLTLVLLGIVALSLMPGIWSWIRSRQAAVQ